MAELALTISNELELVEHICAKLSQIKDEPQHATGIADALLLDIWFHLRNTGRDPKPFWLWLKDLGG